ncbi:MAG TPA: pyridoxamine kinase [Clostridiales bacterium]|nr:pyridoxamine kinase [Clostridiales bacterium]
MPKKLPRVIAAHDIAGYGKCALSVVIPVLSACGVEVCPLPTAFLSSDTSLPHFFMQDLSPQTESYLQSWEKLGLKADAVYSGFLGSALQMESIASLPRRFGAGLTVVDPVMGDHGRVYKTYTKEMCEKMGALCAEADIVTPNLTEACVLTGMAYPGVEASAQFTHTLAEKIASLGCQKVVITGIFRDRRLYNCLYENGNYYEIESPRHPFHMNGTGDLFASVLVGGILTNHSFAESVSSAARFVYYAMEQSISYEDTPRRGVCFEPYLSLLAGGLFQE